MEPIRVTLCPACSACPAVEITDEGVTIGEEGAVHPCTHHDQFVVVHGAVTLFSQV